MSDLTDADRGDLLRLARSAIEARLVTGRRIQRPAGETPGLTAKRGCFVTLHASGHLRGCIGTIEPVHPLVFGVETNAVNAAFRDPRFSPLTAAELPDVEVEISVLTVPETLPAMDPDTLCDTLVPRVHGVILLLGGRSATFLPQVWDQLPEPDRFLQHLSRKAGLPADGWRDPAVRFKIYTAEYFSESRFPPT